MSDDLEGDTSLGDRVFSVRDSSSSDGKVFARAVLFDSESLLSGVELAYDIETDSFLVFLMATGSADGRESGDDKLTHVLHTGGYTSADKIAIVRYDMSWAGAPSYYECELSGRFFDIFSEESLSRILTPRAIEAVRQASDELQVAVDGYCYMRDNVSSPHILH